MRVRVFWIGKTRLPGVAALTAEYAKRLGRYCDFEGHELREAAREARQEASGCTAAEEKLLRRSEGTQRVALDPSGRRWNSEELAGFLRKQRDGGGRALAFCLGGADGFSPEFRKQARLLLSLSTFTMPHELARVVLLEQIYRAWTILAHHPYPR